MLIRMLVLGMAGACLVASPLRACPVSQVPSSMVAAKGDRTWPGRNPVIDRIKAELDRMTTEIIHGLTNGRPPWAASVAGPAIPVKPNRIFALSRSSVQGASGRSGRDARAPRSERDARAPKGPRTKDQSGPDPIYEAWVAPVRSMTQLAQAGERAYQRWALGPIRAWTVRAEIDGARTVLGWARRWRRAIQEAPLVPQSDPTLRLRQWKGWTLRAQSAVQSWLGFDRRQPRPLIGLTKLAERAR